MKLIFAGSGAFGLPTLKAIVDAGHEVSAVVTQLDRPAGRGKKLTPTALAQFAEGRGLEVIKTGDINVEKVAEADLLVVIAFGQKIAPHVVDHARLGGINLHASLLPKYRGAAPINWAILNGEKTTGNTVIRLAQRMDAGAVLAQSEIAIGEVETAGELHDRLAEDGAPLVLRVMDELASGRAVETPQDDSKATTAAKLSREATRIDWGRDARELCWQIRGLYPWPGCRVRLLENQREVDRLTLVRARPAERESADGIVHDDKVGSIEILELQPEGKKPMSLAAYRNGHRWASGMRLESVV